MKMHLSLVMLYEDISLFPLFAFQVGIFSFCKILSVQGPCHVICHFSYI